MVDATDPHLRTKAKAVQTVKRFPETRQDVNTILGGQGISPVEEYEDYDFSGVDLSGTNFSGVDVDYSNTFNTMEPVVSPSAEALAVSQAAVITGAQTGTLFEDAVIAETSGGTYSRDIATEEAQELREQVLDQVAADTLNDPLNLTQATLDRTLVYANNVLGRKTSPFKNEEEYVEQLTPDTFDERADQELAFRVGMANDLAMMRENNPGVDKALDFLGGFVPFNLSIDIRQFLGKVDDEATELDASSINHLVTSFHTLPLERREILWPRIIKMAEDTAGLMGTNTEQAVQILNAFLDPRGGDDLTFARNLDTVLGAAEFVGAGAIKKGVNIAKSGIARNQMIKEIDDTVDRVVVTAVKDSTPSKVAAGAGNTDLAAALDSAVLLEARNTAAQRSLKTGSEQVVGRTVYRGKNPVVDKQTGEVISKGIPYTKTGEVIAELDNVSTAVPLSTFKNGPTNIEVDETNFFGGELTGRALNTSPVDSALNADPFLKESTFGLTFSGLSDGVSGAIAKNLNESQRIANEVVENFEDRRLFAREGLVNKAERDYYASTQAQKLVDEFDDRYVEEGYSLDEVRVSNQTEDSFTLTSNIRDKDGNIVEEIETSFDYKIDQVTGDYSATLENIKGGKRAQAIIGSPSWYSKHATDSKKVKSDFRDDFLSMSRLDDISASALKDLEDFFDKNVLGPVKGDKKAQQRVADMIKFLDNNPEKGSHLLNGEVHLNELYAGFEVPRADGSIKTLRLLQPKEIESFYSMRIFTDMLYQVKGRSMSKKAKLMGFKQVSVFGEPKMSTTYDRAADAKSISTKSSASTSVYDKSTDSVVSLKDVDIDKMYEKGYILSRHREGVRIPERVKNETSDDLVEYSFVKEVSELPDNILHYRPFYNPKISEGVEFLVKTKQKKGKMNGEPVVDYYVTRYFSNKADAEDFRNGLKAEEVKRINREVVDPETRQRLLDELDDPDQPTFDVVKDRRTKEQTPLDEHPEYSGGLYDGARSTEDILYGKYAEQAKQVNPFETLQRYSAHVSRAVPRNDIRLAMEQRWLNTYAMYVSKDLSDGFDVKLGDSAVEVALKDLRDQIKSWNSIPTREETLWTAMNQQLHDWALNAARKTGAGRDKNAIHSILYLKHSDPVSALKSSVFHTTLGMLNPVQIFVQGQAMTLALSRYPRLAPQGIAYSIRMSMLDLVKNPKARVEAYKKLKDDGIDPSLLQETHEAWVRSGLADSVRANADTVAIEQGVGNSFRSFGKLMDKGLLFYRSGEMANRRVSFSMSYLNWKNKNPGKTPDNDEFKTILSDAKQSMLELNRANAARWQGGANATPLENITGLMLQFAQVAFKTGELAFKREAQGGFSLSQKRNILLGQAALYGAAGVPLGAYLLKNSVEAAGGNIDDLSEEELEFLNEGIIGGLTEAMLGADVRISDRAAIFDQTLQTFNDILTGETSLMSLETLGASGAMVNRSWEAFRSAAVIINTQKTDMKSEDFAAVFRTFADIPSSTRNILKAMVMENSHMLFDRRNRVVDWGDFSSGTEFLVAMGFRTDSEAELFELKKLNLKYDQKVRAAADFVIFHAAKYKMNRPYEGNMSDEAFEGSLSAAGVMFLGGDNEKMLNDVRRLVAGKIYGDRAETMLEKELKKSFDKKILTYSAEEEASMQNRGAKLILQPETVGESNK